MRVCGRITIEYGRCDGCGECVELCPVSVFRFRDGRVVAEGVCILCLGCLAVCGKRAIRIDVERCPTEVEVEVV